MAAVNVTINGVICDLYGRTITGPVKVVGEMMYSDRVIGGGPIFPQPPEEKPPGIWPGPGDPDYPAGGPHPEHPIVIPPNKPDVPPDTIWPGPGDPDFPGGPHPEHPIVLPPPGNPIQPGTLVNWKAVWVPPAVTGGDGSWMIVGVPNVPHPAPSR